MAKNILGAVLWQGVSALDGAPIACILTLDSKNPKTGKLTQTWIIRTDVKPNVAVSSGKDYSVCGDCPHRPILATAFPECPREPCYVETAKAPSSVFEAFQRGRYAQPGTEEFARVMAIARVRGVRVGSYGDPALVPATVWASLRCVTGYTHLWRRAWAQAHRAWCMASCDGTADVAEAQAMGWRTFEAVRAGEAHTGDAVECPNVKRGVLCDDCGLCNGTTGRAKSVWLEVHGPRVSTCSVMELSGKGRLQVWAV